MIRDIRACSMLSRVTSPTRQPHNTPEPWAVGLTRSLFVKELYVVEAARRNGVGWQLMRTLFEVAVKHDCSRVEWQTEITNADARAFYAELGAPEFEGKVFYRLGGASLQQALIQEA